MRFKQTLFVLLLLPGTAFSQKKFTISGYAKDVQNGETLIGATISVKEQTKGVSSNQFGFYSITLTEGDYSLICSYAGYQPKPIDIKLITDRLINFELIPRTALDEVVVTSKKKRCECEECTNGKICFTH